MERIGYTSYSDPRLPQPVDQDDRIAPRAADLRAIVISDPKLLAAECAEVLGWDSSIETDLAALFDVPPFQLDARCLAFAHGLLKKVEDRITRDAFERATIEIEARDIADELDRAEAAEAARETSRTFWGVA